MLNNYILYHICCTMMHGKNGVGSFNSWFLKNWELSHKLETFLCETQMFIRLSRVFFVIMGTGAVKLQTRAKKSTMKVAVLKSIVVICCKFSSLL